MLYRIKATEAEQDQHRLWFSDTNHDLFLWMDDQNRISAFQYCYNKLENEHAISWHQTKGYNHHRVDAGESENHRYKMSPILLADGEFEPQQIASEFNRICRDIDPELADFVYLKLLDYPHLTQP